MTDLTKLTTPFGLLDKETQDSLKAHGGPYEVFGSFGRWIPINPHWSCQVAYRVKPSPVVETRTGRTGRATDSKWRPLQDEYLVLECPTPGTYTLTLHDGKPVKLVWEAE